ncbi:MAG: T9SS type A sorting domain-containing protein [Ginsengibacter sp.]
MKKIYLLFFGCFITTIMLAQTNPAAQMLPFNFTTQTGGVLPDGMAAHKFAAIPTTRILTPGTADLPYIVGSTSGGWNDQGVNGIGILASGTNQAGALIVAVNTTGKTGITASWKVRTILNQASRDNSIALQYRVGTTGNFIDVGTTSTFSSTGTVAGDATSYSELLPSGAENQAVVQLRWIYWESAGTAGSRDRLAITNINIAPPSGPCVTPTMQPTALVFGAINDVSIAGSFTASSPAADEYLVVMSANNMLTSDPVDGQPYNVGDGLGDGTVIAKGTSLSFNATALAPSTTYHFFIFSINSACTSGPKYLSPNPLTGTASTVAGLPDCVASTTQPTNLVFSNTTVTSISGAFSPNGADEYLVLQSTSSTLSNNPVNGTVYNPGNALGNATVIQRNGNSSFTSNSLAANTTYYYFIFSISSQNCVNGPVYNITNSLSGNETTLPLPPCSTPTDQPSNLLLSPSNTAISGSFAASASADDYLVIRSNNPTLAGQPVDNTVYNIGDNIGGGIVIANSNSTSFATGGLTPSSSYYFFIYAANMNCIGGTKYFTVNPLTGNTTTTSAPLNNVYFGNLHSHSDYSDGNKDNPGYTPADDYTYAMTAQCMDYLGISEHNHFSSANNPGNIITTYHMGSTQANSFTSSHSNFLAMYGMEWGVISGGGHVVVYGDGMDKLFGWETTVPGVGINYDVFVAKNDYTGPDGLFKTINDYIANNTFASLAHPNSTDFGNIASTYNAVADEAITGTAVESGPAFSTNTTYTDPGSSMSYLSYFLKMLAKGYHLGPTIDHDNHNTTFGHTTYSRTAIIAPSLTKTEIVKAMRNMHFYATQDCDSKLDFTINTKIMGSVFTDRGSPVMSVNLTDATTTTSTAIIKIMYGNPGSGVLPESIYSVTGNTLSFSDNNLADLATGYYYVDVTNGTSRIISAPIWYTRNDGVVLPVKLSAFDVEKINSSVKIYWITAQENNSSYFIVQHSIDGRRWSDIGQVNAMGFSVNLTQYSMMDNAPNIGINLYRLEQLDRDGKTQYSTVKSVLFSKGYDVLITPNPATAYINVYLSRSSNTTSKISLYQINGILVKQIVTSNSTLQINTSSFAKGLYFIKVIDGDKVITQKILIQ